MIIVWTDVDIAFAVETFIFKTGESVIIIQTAFRAHIMLRQDDPVLKRVLSVLIF